MKDRKQLGIVAAVACIAVLVAGWFLLVSPTRASAADVRSSAAQKVSSNQSLRAQIASLSAIAAQLPQQKAELDKLTKRVPADADLPTLIRQLAKTASDAGVQVNTFTPSRPAPLPDLPGVQGLDIAMTLHGNYTQLEEFLVRLESLPRAFLVLGITLGEGASSAAGSTSSTTSAASSGTAGTGGLTATLSGRVLVGPPSAAVPGTPK